MICKKCKEDKEIEEYNDTANLSKDGKFVKRSDCKSCQKKYRNLYYIYNKERELYNQRIRRWKKKK